MGTLEGFALPSAPATRPATPALRAASPNPPALWRRRAKPTYAYAIMGTLGRVPKPYRDGPQANRP